MIFNKPSRNNWPCCIIWQVIFQLLESMRVRRASVRRVTRVSLSHLQRDLEAQEVGVMHQISYSSSVSTFFSNEIKARSYKSIQWHILFFRKKMAGFPYARCHFRWEFSTVPLNHSREN